jgi:hypothetical protein
MSFLIRKTPLSGGNGFLLMTLSLLLFACRSSWVPVYDTEILPVPQEFGYGPPSNAFTLLAESSICIPSEWTAGHPIRDELATLLSSCGIDFPRFQDLDSPVNNGSVIVSDLQTRSATLDSLLNAFNLDAPAQFQDEEYRLGVNQNVVLLIGQRGKGVYYGIQTLGQLLKPNRPGKNGRIPAVRIRDFPDMPLRAVYYGFHLKDWRSDALLQRGYRDINTFAELKFNMIALDNHHYAQLNRPVPGHPEERYGDRMAPFFDYCRKHFLSPRIGGWPHWFGEDSAWTTDITLLEGIRTQCQITLESTTPAPLTTSNGDTAYKVIHNIQSKTSWSQEPVIVSHADDSLRFKYGRDYIIDFAPIRTPYYDRVIAGDGEPAGFPLRRALCSDPPTTIRRTPHSRIRDGETVNVSFTYIGPDPWSPCKVRYCRSDPRIHQDDAQNAIWRWCSQPAQQLGAKLFNLEMDEIRVLGWDQRCQNAGKTRSELMADDILYYYRTLHRVCPDALIMMWSDMLDPSHHAVAYQTTALADCLIERGLADIVMVPWDEGHARQSIAYLASRGFSIMASAQSEPAAGPCAPMWAELLRQRGDKIDTIGLMHAPWHYSFDTSAGRDHLSITADCAWSSGPYIEHMPVRCAKINEPLRISARIHGDRYAYDGTTVIDHALPIRSAVLFYRKHNTRSFTRSVMKRNGDHFTAVIPDSFLSSDHLEYYIRVSNRNHTRYAPVSAPQSAYAVTILHPARKDL